MDDQVLHVLYLDLRRTIDHQHERLRHVRERAGVLLAASVGSAVLLWPDPSTWNALHLVALMAFFVVIAAGAAAMIPVRFSDIRMQLTDLNRWNPQQTRSEFGTAIVGVARQRLRTSETVVQRRNTLLRVLSVALVLQVCASGAAATL